MRDEKREKMLLLVNNKITVSNIYNLEKLGAGIDGIVFRYHDLALKLLKYDISERKKNNLMTFEKIRYFEQELDLKRITMPIDIMLDADGVFAGYAMKYLDDVTIDKNKDSPIYKRPGDFKCGDFVYAIMEFYDDFEQLTKKRVLPIDINKKSYIYTQSYVYLCDIDKYQIADTNIARINRDTLNYIVGKILYYTMMDIRNYNKDELKQISKWFKQSIHCNNFIAKIINEIGSNYNTTMSEFSMNKVKHIIH